MPFVCDPPNTVPPAVIQLADRYEYSCAQKRKPIQNIGDFDVYRVSKYNFFISYILFKDNNARFADNNEAKKIDFFCGWGDGNGCQPCEIVDNAYHPIIIK